VRHGKRSDPGKDKAAREHEMTRRSFAMAALYAAAGGAVKSPYRRST
jgi:hypothetical protein